MQTDNAVAVIINNYVDVLEDNVRLLSRKYLLTFCWISFYKENKDVLRIISKNDAGQYIQKRLLQNYTHIS